jgi:hypothetical protein
MPSFGHSTILWTARLAVGCYVVSLLLGLSASPSRRNRQAARIAWTVGAVIFLLHVVAAFHFAHDWSHHAAYEHTAQQTNAVTGLNWGGGLWFNYAFTLLWVADAAGWWGLGLEFPQNFPRWSRIVRWTFAFMMFNATVVFGPPYWRWLGGMLALAWILLRRREHSRR